MRICHVITRLIVGGAQENTILTCEGLASRGHEVTLIAGPTSGPEGSLVERAQRGFYRFIELQSLVRSVRPIADLRAIAALRRVFRDLSPDVVHTHSSKAGIVGRLAAADAGVPTIVHTIHGMSFNRTQPPWVAAGFAELERLCAGLTHIFISVADAMTRQALAAGIGSPGQYVTIPSGIEMRWFDLDRYDPAAVRAELGFRSHDIVVATIARLFRNKGYEQLIPAMARAARREPRLRFLWIGDGADRARYRAQLNRLGLVERTRCVGLVQPNEVPRLLAAADLLVHASRWEGLPRAVVQALLMRRAVVACDLDGAGEVVIPGQTGELVAADDIEGLAQAMLRLAGDPVVRHACGEAGRRLCLRRFDHDVMVSAIEATYQRAGRR